jgi:hypothetical protein
MERPKCRRTIKPLKRRKQAKFKKKPMPQSQRWSEVEVRQKDEGLWKLKFDGIEVCSLEPLWKQIYAVYEWDETYDDH